MNSKKQIRRKIKFDPTVFLFQYPQRQIPWIFSFFLFCLSIVPFVFAQGLVIPAGSTVNVNSGTLNVGGDVTNAGTLQTTTGTISTSGNWANSATFTPTTGTVTFTKSSGTQTLTSGGTGAGKLFYHLTHTGLGTLQFLTNDVDVDGNFSNTAGTVDVNSRNMTVAGNWNNSTGATFSPSTATVTLDGTNQTMTGSTTFYNLTKTVAAAATLTFENTKEQIVSGTLTLHGAIGQLLSLNSDDDDASPTKSKLTLQAGGLQVLSFLNVKNNDAGNGLTLIAGTSSVNSGNNINWVFGGTTFVWQGDVSTDWNTPGNWDLGAVPTSVDTVSIPNVSPNAQPTLTSNVTVANLTISSGAIVTLAGNNLTVSSVFANSGTIKLQGNETVTLTQDLTNPGTFQYVGDNDGVQDTYAGNLLSSYYNLSFNDTNGADIYVSNGNINLAGNLNVTAGTLNISTNTNTLTAAGTLTVDGGTFTATNGNIDANGSVVVSGGTFTVPTTGKSFTVAGNFSHSGGTFTHSSGIVTLDGVSQILSGNTTFFGLSKITANGTLTFTVGGTQTIAAGGSLTLQGTSGNPMTINSSVAGTKANLTLTAGATQAVKYTTVRDNDASGGLTIVARNSTESPVSSTIHWVFGAATITWNGSTSTDWNVADNWDLGLVPDTLDTAIIPNVATQPTLTTNVTVENLTLNTGAILTTAGKNLTVNTTFSNSGTVSLQGLETVTLTPDTDSGTFQYLGDNDGVQDTYTGTLLPTYFNLTFNDTNGADIFRSTANVTVNGDLNVTAGTLDISTNANTLTTAGTLNVNGGILTATNANIDANGSVAVSSGTLTAPTTGKSFTVAGNFTHSGGIFTNSSGTVTLDTAATSVISGNTTFDNLTSTTAGKTIQVTAGTTQTVSGTLTLLGTASNKIVLQSTTSGTQYTMDVPGGVQSVQYVNVSDSNAASNDINCVACTNSGGNDNAAASPHWIFINVVITVPAAGGQTINTLPTIIGTADAAATVNIKDSSNTTIASTTADANGNWRVEATTAMAAGANSLTPYVGLAFGQTVNVTVSAAPTTDDYPTITSPAAGQRILGPTPTLTGKGLANASVDVVANDANGNLLLASVGSGTVNASGNYSVTLTTALPKGTNYLSVTIDGVASHILTVSLTDPFGTVFDSVTSNPIEGATVTIYRAATNVPAVPGVDLDAADVNPLVTTSNGFYSFLAANGNYYMTVTAVGYDYPTVQTSFPAGRTVTTGSKGETFAVAGVVLQIDHPMDSNSRILRITKDANKSEVRIGEIVTYTVSMENKTTTSVADVHIEDRIPPGFKYVDNRVILDGVPIANPSGNRPVSFNVGIIQPGQTRTLKYQLVVGSGVTVGKYENTAVAKYSNGQVISNTAGSTVKVVLDPLFDLGTVVGKIYFDLNENGRQDAPEYVEMDRETIKEGPVPNVKIVMEDGTIITADKNGQFSLQGINPGRHLFRLDERTLPDGAFLTTDKVMVVDVTSGGIFKVNFGVGIDNARFNSEDQKFFTTKINVSQDKNSPKPRLNVALWDKEIAVYNDIFVNKAEFRIFANYTPFIDHWRLEIIDAGTKRTVKVFEGNRQNIFDPILWDGKDDQGKYIHLDRQYQYIVTVLGAGGKYDETKEKSITMRVLKDESELNTYQDDRKKGRDDYERWLLAQSTEDALSVKNILVTGETLQINGITPSIHTIRVMKNNQMVTELPIIKRQDVTAKDLIDGNVDHTNDQTNVDLILPKGQYQVIIQDKTDNAGGSPKEISSQGAVVGGSSQLVSQSQCGEEQGVFKSYSKNVSVGEDYLFFVGLGDAKVGYTINRGNIEPVQQDDKFKDGFWSEGKAAYYLKGKILGKYLITSSYDSDRNQKALFKTLDPNQYYPIYGDGSSKDYQATDTQGNLYLLVEWDKSSAIWGNYKVDFTDTEMAQFTRTLYGGKLDYKSVASTKYGDAKQRLVIYRAKAQQRAAHVEMLATGGSLYYLKHAKVIEGSDKVKVEVRDKITGLVVATRDMKNNADYNMDYENGRMLFWKPVPAIVDSYGIISNQLLEGNFVYVIADYEYESQDKVDDANVGARVRQAITDNVVVGGTYVKEHEETKDYTLKGTDVDLHLGPNAKITAEYARSEAQAAGTFVSTDGGLTYTELTTNADAIGRAYGIKGDARLFNRMGVQGYYKWIDSDFSSTSTSAQQGKELIGFALSYDLSQNTSISARQDIQSILDQGNAQTQAQVGAEKTTTTMVQIVHDLRKLKLTGEYQRQEITAANPKFTNPTDTQRDTVALRADYKLTDKTEISLEQQKTLKGDNNDQTTVGIKTSPKEGLTVEAAETIGTGGTKTKLGTKLDLAQKLSFSADETFTSDANGQFEKVSSVGVASKIDDKTSLQTGMGVTDKTNGEHVSTLSFGGTSQIDDTTSNTSSIAVSDSTVDGKKTSFTFGTKKKLRDDLELATTRTFGTAINENSTQDNYSLIREKDGHRLEGTLSRKYADSINSVSRTNIFGLSGDLNDRFAFTGSVERGTVQNLNGSTTDHTAITTALGYVRKDEETGEQVLKSSSKFELIMDSGNTDTRQFLISNDTEGKITPEISLFNKLEFSRTMNLTDDTIQAEYKELMIGGAYRPIDFDRLNMLARYTFLQNKSPSGQTNFTNVDKQQAHVFAAEGIYDINEKWQLSEKYAYRIMEEKVAGFDFTKTHTWLMIHRLNYNIDSDWLIGGEFRVLSVEEAKDSKRGFLVEAARRMGAYAQLGVGYNFTDFSDDLTALSYTAQGPFVRLTGKFYDQTPEEVARAQAKWIDEKIVRWAWAIVQDELSRKDSPVLYELNRYYKMADLAHQQHKWEEARQIYKDILVAGEMMIDEASEYIRSKIEEEKDWKNQLKVADGYYRSGEYEKARKILEKVLEDIHKRMLELSHH